MTKQQQAVLNTPEAMKIIIEEAKKAIAVKFGTSLEIVNAAILARNENVLSMMRQFSEVGVNETAAAL